MKKQLFGKKVGMAQFFADSGEVYAATAVYCPPSVVVRKKTIKQDGYEALVIAFDETSAKRITKPQQGQLKGVGSYRSIKEIAIDKDLIAKAQIGDVLDVKQFTEGDLIDIQGYSKGKGFAGTVKRHNFSRGPTTHGHDHHRAPGSIGATSTPGRVFKGIRMSGRMGNEKVSVIGQVIVKIDPVARLVYVKGSVPGARNTLVRLQTSIKAK